MKPLIDVAWSEYESVAGWCAKAGKKGVAGDALPDFVSVRAMALIDADPEAFERRVRDHAYYIAQTKGNR